MPTFVLLSNGEEVDRLMGANVEMLEAKIVQHLKEDIATTPEEREFLEKILLYSQRVSHQTISALFCLCVFLWMSEEII